MSKLQDNFNLIMAKIEEKITNTEDLDFIKQQIANISMLYIDELNKIIDLSERRVNQVYENQRMLEKKLTDLEKGMTTIEKELFVEDDYDFEIVCPYCNYEFLTDINSDKNEIECPECHNIIELDWNAEESDCSDGHCNSCKGCTHEQDEEKETTQEQDENDDDM